MLRSDSFCRNFFCIRLCIVLTDLFHNRRIIGFKHQRQIFCGTEESVLLCFDNFNIIFIIENISRSRDSFINRDISVHRDSLIHRNIYCGIISSRDILIHGDKLINRHIIIDRHVSLIRYIRYINSRLRLRNFFRLQLLLLRLRFFLLGYRRYRYFLAQVFGNPFG